MRGIVFLKNGGLKMKKFITFLLISMAALSGNAYADANTDFQTAVSEGNLDNAMKALKAGAKNVNAVDATGQTALHYAVAKGDFQSVLALAKGGANATARDTHYKRTVVDLAISQLAQIGQGLMNNPQDATMQQQAVIYTQILHIVYSIQFKVV